MTLRAWSPSSQILSNLGAGKRSTKPHLLVSKCGSYLWDRTYVWNRPCCTNAARYLRLVPRHSWSWTAWTSHTLHSCSYNHNSYKQNELKIYGPEYLFNNFENIRVTIRPGSSRTRHTAATLRFGDYTAHIFTDIHIHCGALSFVLSAFPCAYCVIHMQ